MQVIVVYESHWGNTAAIARAIAEGIGAGGRVRCPPLRQRARRLRTPYSSWRARRSWASALPTESHAQGHG